jgi:uncharacterized protein
MNHKLIVIDTNILISAALSPDGTARKALNKAYKHSKSFKATKLIKN